MAERDAAPAAGAGSADDAASTQPVTPGAAAADSSSGLAAPAVGAGGTVDAAAPTFTRAGVAAACASGGAHLVIIHNEVYDLSRSLSGGGGGGGSGGGCGAPFLTAHPGGADVLLEFVGRDATGAFEGVGHSGQARRMLAGLRVGRLAGAEVL
jgi:cytochrome b involved in lipid metabolism